MTSFTADVLMSLLVFILENFVLFQNVMFRSFKCVVS